jgi:hypothetical protein
MPRLANRNAGIKQVTPGNYQARVFHNRKEESKNFARLEEAQRWQRNLKSDLERCPQDIQRINRKWKAHLVIASGVVSKDFENLNDAIKWIDQGKVQVSLGTWVDPDQQNKTLDAYVITWRSGKTSTSGKTLGTYDSQLKNHIIPTFGNRKLTSITTAEVRTWVSQLEASGVGSITIRQSYRLLHQILESALIDELIVRNPAIGIRLPKPSKKKASALTVDQVHALADACGKYSLLIKFLAMTGVRINEALALRVGDLNFEISTVHISRTWTSTESGKKILGQTKTREVRDIPLSSDLKALLQEQAAGLTADAWLFTGSKSDALDYGYFRRAHFEPAVKRLGLENVTIHTLRHTCASLLISLQAPITTVSQILGHASVKMTLDTYGHYYKTDATAWINAYAALFSEAAGK